MIPAPAIIPRSMSFIDATPSSSTRQLSTSAFSVKRSSSPARSISAPVRLEALSGLGPEIARRRQLPHALMDVEAVPVALPEVLGEARHGVESEQVGQEERAHRGNLRVRDDLVDLLDRAPGLLLVAPGLRRGRADDPVDDEPGAVLRADRHLPDRLGEG